jgi:hypothetical protein
MYLFLCCLVIFLEARKWWSRSHLIGAAIASGLAFLTRYNGLILPVGMVGLILLVNPHSLPWQRRLKDTALCLAVFGLVIAPWYAVNQVETGRLLATRNLQNIFVEEFYGGAHEGRMPQSGLDTLPEVILNDPLHFLGTYLGNLPGHMWRDLRFTLNHGTSILFLLGLLRLLIVPPRRKQWSFLIFPLCYFLAMGAVYHQPRFALPLLPAYLAIGFALLWGDGNRHRSRLAQRLDQLGSASVILTKLVNRTRPYPSRIGIIISIITVGLFGWQTIDTAAITRSYYTRRPLFILDAGAALAHLSKGDGEQTIMARKPHIAYYSGLRYQPYPRRLSTVTALLDFAQDHQVRYIFYSGIERNQFPDQLFLQHLDTATNVTKVYADDYCLVYELAPGATPRTAENENYRLTLLQDLAAAEGQADQWRIFRICRKIAEQHLADWDWSSVAHYLERGLQADLTAQTPQDAYDIALMKLDLALAYLNLTRNEAGIALLTANLTEFERHLTRDKLANAHVYLAVLYENTARLDAASVHLRTARDLFRSLGDQQRAHNVEQRLIELNRAESE